MSRNWFCWYNDVKLAVYKYLMFQYVSSATLKDLFILELASSKDLLKGFYPFRVVISSLLETFQWKVSNQLFNRHNNRC